MALLKKYWLIVILLVWVVAWYALSDDRPVTDEADPVATEAVEPDVTAASDSSAPVAAPSDVEEPAARETVAEPPPESEPQMSTDVAPVAPVTETAPEAPEAVDVATPREERAAVAPSREEARNEARDEARRAERPMAIAPMAPPARPSAFAVNDVIREARSLYWSEGLDAAIFVLERALGRSDISDRDRARLLAELGDAYFAAGRLDHARTAYRSSVLQLPPSERAMMEQRYRHQGRW